MNDEERTARRERRLQNLAFLGGVVILALVLFAAFSMNRPQDEIEDWSRKVTVHPLPTSRLPLSPVPPTPSTSVYAYPALLTAPAVSPVPVKLPIRVYGDVRIEPGRVLLLPHSRIYVVPLNDSSQPSTNPRPNRSWKRIYVPPLNDSSQVPPLPTTPPAGSSYP